MTLNVGRTSTTSITSIYTTDKPILPDIHKIVNTGGMDTGG